MGPIATLPGQGQAVAPARDRAPEGAGVAPEPRPARRTPGVRLRWLLLAVILAAGWYLRARHPHYSTAFMDESIYVVYGRMFLAHHFESPLAEPLHFSFGWFLWPAMAATADRVAGLAGVRELTALLGTLTVLLVYGFSRRLYGSAEALASAAVFALLGPAILTSRIATHEAACLFFFALGLWLYARAWQENERVSWGLAAAAFFAAFLCKYLIALFFPFLVLLTLRKGRRAVAWFSAPLAIFCGAYAWHYARDLAALLRYAHSYSSLRASDGTALKIYFSERPDFWALDGLALFTWMRKGKAAKTTAVLLCLGSSIIPAFQWFARSDYDYWKTVTYSLLFLVPLGTAGLVYAVREVAPLFRPLVATLLAAVLAFSLAWGSSLWRIDRFLFWPNVSPVVTYFQGRLAAQDRVLVDDSVFRYYFQPPLSQSRITDPFFFWYGNDQGAPAYRAAVRDRWFSYIVLDGGIGGEAGNLQAAIRPELAGRYALKLATKDAVLGQPIEIYERENPPAPAPAAPSPVPASSPLPAQPPAR
jgi:Dolichyl-phosphate-mannose-protein mannosyltransferase